MFRFLTFSSVAIASVAGILACLVGLLFVTTPRPTDIRSCLTTKMFQVRLCPTDPGYVKLDAISPHLRHAVIVSEDGAFYDHHGFDFHELEESLRANWEKGGFARGGSTITQQLVKNVYLSADKSLLRKVREAIIVIQIEGILNKDEILEKYLNIVEFGPELYGIGNAAKFYFHKSPADLNPAESAFLAFLLPSPKKHSISFHKKQMTKFALTQTSEIVNRLYRYKRISDLDQSNALTQLRTLFSGASVGAFDSSTTPADTPVEESDESTPDDGD
jgi:monofunctional biosynthetic peptidoglycan transglycosylase